MVDFLNVLFRSISPLWEMSVTAAYAAAVVIVLRLLLKKRVPKQVLCLLWLVVFARLLIPVSLESPLSIVPDALPGQTYHGSQAPADPGAGNPAAPVAPRNPSQGQTQNQPGHGAAAPVTGNQNPPLSVPEGVSPTTPAPEAPAAFPWQAVVAGVWLTGVAAMGGYGLVSWLRLRRRLFDAIRAKDGAWEHPAVESPFILGVLRPRIYLPAGLTGRPRRFILCHERAHLRRLDHIVKPVCWVALALHWFNPLVWAAFLLMSRDIESACDESVVRLLGSRVKADYSYTLLALATGRQVPAPCPLAFGEGDAKGRIRNVLNYRRPALWVIIVSVVAAALAAVCLLTDPVAAREPEGDPDPGAAASQDPDTVTSQPPVNNLADDLLDPWMKEVLNGEREFLMDDGKGTLTVDQLFEAIYGTDLDFYLNVTVSKVAIIDLDRDGINEMVVWPSIAGDDSLGAVSTPGYLILRRQGDTVYGYNPNYRGFNQLKADGTFGWSGGAFHHGTGSAQFTENGFEVKDITWCDISTDMDSLGDAHFFVDGRKATSEEFEAAIAAQDAKPEPTWYFYRDGVLFDANRLNLAAVSVDNIGVPVPEFLNEEQRTLYAQALSLYSRLFSPNSEIAFSDGDGTAEGVEYNGKYYCPTHVYGSWDEFEETLLSVFTQNFWTIRNKDDLYVNINGTMHYVPYARGGYGYNENFPETFRLVEMTEDTVSFLMTGYYIESRHEPGITDEQWENWLAANWEYSVEFPMRMVWTANGWRFDEFYSAMLDNGRYPFFDRWIPNPDAVPLSSAEPTPAPERTVISEFGGMQIVSVGDVYRLIWSENGQEFPVGPEPVPFAYNAWVEDFDEDGKPEAIFPDESSFPFTIYDMVDGALVGYSFPYNFKEIYDDITRSAVTVYDPDTRELTITYSWNGAEVPSRITLPEDFFDGFEQLTDGRTLYAVFSEDTIHGVMLPAGQLWFRAEITLTDGVTAGPVVGKLNCTVQYSDSGFYLKDPGEIQWL